MVTKLVRRTLAATMFGAVACGVGPLAHAQGKLTVIRSLQCPLGCGAVVYDLQLSNMMARKGSRISLAPQETPGYMYNIRYMDKNYEKAQATIFGTEDMVLQLAPHGGKGILKDSLPEPITKHFKFLWQFAAPAQGRFFVTFDPNIKTIADMKGKKVAVGLLTQSDWGLGSRMTLEAYGLTYENTQIQHLTPAVVTTQLINGTVDAATSAILGDPATNKWATGGPLIKIGAAAQASGRKLHYISVDQAHMDKINKQWGTTLFTATIPAKTLPQQQEPVTVGLNRAYLAATVDFSPEIAYELTKAVLQYGPDLQKEGGLWAYWSKAGVVSGLTECNTNPGSVRAYKEFDVWGLRSKGGPEAKIPGC